MIDKGKMVQTTTLDNYKVAFITLGCAKNEVDSDKMRARILAAGFDVIDDESNADAIIINTCSFITEATEEAINVIFNTSALENVEQGSSKIIVTGCMPSRYGEELNKQMPEVSAFLGCGDEEKIVDVIAQALDIEALVAEALQEKSSGGTLEAPHLMRSTKESWAYVKIADGCDRKCTFCTIPTIKGRYQSVHPEKIFAEVNELVSIGVKEIVLIAQDTGIWGRDLASPVILSHKAKDLFLEHSDGYNLATLLNELACKFPKTWFRVMYLQPQGITDKLLEVMANHDNICNYLDIPLQHASARIIKEMNRKGGGAEYLAMIKRIRAALPDAALRTSVIAGFPGESRSEAKELEDFIEQAAFDYVGVFIYSQEDNTVAGQRSDQVPMRTRKARAQRLRDLADRIGFEKAASQVDTVQDTLIVAIDEDQYLEDDNSNAEAQILPLLGRTKRQAPDVDGMIHLDSGSIGDIVSVRMVEAYCYDLDGEVVKQLGD